MGTVYTSAKLWHFPEQLAALENGGLAPPVHIRLKPTNVCNHACYFCAYRTDDVALGEDMNLGDRIPPAKMAEIVEDIVAMGVQAVTFSRGGEPLLYPTIVETVEALAAGGVRLAALTNASQLRAKRARAFADHGTWIRVSIDGWDGPSYARYRGVDEDEFGKVINNLYEFAKLNSECLLGSSIIDDEQNAGHVAELAAKLKDAGVRHAKIAPCIVDNDGRANNAYHAGFAATVRDQIALAQELDDADFAVVDHYHSLAEKFDKAHSWCPSLQFLTVIGADCTVYSCQDKAYTEGGKLGSIAEQRFSELWFSEHNRQRLRAINPAQDCRHHCVAEAKNRLLLDYLEADSDHVPFV